MEASIDSIAGTIKQSLTFPEKTKGHGFSEEIDAGSFREIEHGDDAGGALISAIDGGSCTVLRTPTMAIVLNRIYFPRRRLQQEEAGSTMKQR